MRIFKVDDRSIRLISHMVVAKVVLLLHWVIEISSKVPKNKGITTFLTAHFVIN